MQDFGCANNDRDTKRNQTVDTANRQTSDDALNQLVGGHPYSPGIDAKIQSHHATSGKHFCIRMQNWSRFLD
jgi:hypothetical protein